MPPPGDGSGGRREGVRMRFKRAGLLTKVVVMVLLIYMATALLDLHGQIQTIQVEREELNQQVAAQQLENQQLANAIENSDDPDMLESVARDKGYVKSGETLYIDVGPTDHPGNGPQGGKFYKEDISVAYGVWCWVHCGWEGYGNHKIRCLCGPAGREIRLGPHL